MKVFIAHPAFPFSSVSFSKVGEGMTKGDSEIWGKEASYQPHTGPYACTHECLLLCMVGSKPFCHWMICSIQMLKCELTSFLLNIPFDNLAPFGLFQGELELYLSTSSRNQLTEGFIQQNLQCVPQEGLSLEPEPKGELT